MPGTQAWPHAPQAIGSVCVLTQELPHLVRPELQVKLQVPLVHVAVPPAGAEQAVHDAPQ